MGLALADLPQWPEGMNWDVALAYTGVGEAQLRAWQRAGKVIFRPRGPKGAMLAMRADLERALRDMFTTDIAEDLDFG